MDVGSLKDDDPLRKVTMTGADSILYIIDSILCNTRKLFSIEDRGQTDLVDP